MKKKLILIVCLPLSIVFMQVSQIELSGTSTAYLTENNSICADNIIVGQDASFIAEFYGDVLEGNCTTFLTPTGDGTITLPIELTDIEALPTVFTLKSAYPNPFNPITTIHYGIPDTRNVSIVIYDIQGRQISTIFNKKQEPGWYEIAWNGLLNDGSLAPAGIYLYQIKAADELKTSKISLIK